MRKKRAEKMADIIVIGGGFAGTEAAMQLAKRGIKVTLYEMKPEKFSPAHSNAGLAELVCSNSFKATRLGCAAGLLKAEMKLMGSLCVDCAEKTAVPAGGALAVDRDKFSALVTQVIENEPLITVVRKEITEIPASPAIIAAGPLASETLSGKISELCNGNLSFFDAAAPIVTADSIDMSRAFCQSRYDRGEPDDYINCPLSREEYEAFYGELIKAETAPVHGFDKNNGVYEGCMPVEVMAKRGKDTIRFGPMKPSGLTDPVTGRRPFANLQLRKENAQGTMYNLVGFQTNLKFGEQKRVFSMIPALKNAEFVRYGVMHRNTFINSPEALEYGYRFKARENLWFAGQITGVEGYMESAGSGITAGINAARYLQGKPPLKMPATSMLSSLARYVCTQNKNFQPMGASFGLLPPLETGIRDKRERYEALSNRALADLRECLAEQGELFEEE